MGDSPQEHRHPATGPQGDDPPSDQTGGDPHAGPPSIGPVTDACGWGRHGGAAEGEWSAACSDPGDWILLWAGCYRGHGDPRTILSWSWLNASIGDPHEAPQVKSGEAPLPPPLDASIAVRIQRMLTPLAHEARLGIVQALWSETLGADGLAAATSLRQADLRYHLEELVAAEYVEEADGVYALTTLGRQLFLTFANLAASVVLDSGEGGLTVRRTA